MQSTPRDEPIGRRGILGAITLVVGAVISGVYAIPAIGYLIGPSFKRAGDAWQSLASVSKVELGTPTLFKARIEQQTGWITEQKEVAAYVLSENGRDFIAMSNICTHLGCRVRWIEERDQFFCPCHNGVFARDGTVISGPPPRPLDRYSVKVEQDQIFILLD